MTSIDMTALPAALKAPLSALLDQHAASERRDRDEAAAQAQHELDCLREPDSLTNARTAMVKALAAAERADAAATTAREALQRARSQHDSEAFRYNAQRQALARQAWPAARRAEVLATIDAAMAELTEPFMGKLGARASLRPLGAAVECYQSVRRRALESFESGSPLDLDALLAEAASEGVRRFRKAVEDGNTAREAYDKRMERLRREGPDDCPIEWTNPPGRQEPR